MKLSDSFFKKVEKKTNVDKNTILSLAEKLQNNNMKNEDALKEISVLTGKEVSKEKEDKIINTIMNDKVPDNLDKFVN